MDALLYFLIATGALITGYVVSLYSLAVYLDPEEIISMIPRMSGRRREYVMRLAGDPRALTQIATVFKSFVLILNSAMTIFFVRSLSQRVDISPYYPIPVGLVIVWLIHLFFFEYLPRRSSRRAMNRLFPRYFWLVTTVYVVFLPVLVVYRYAMARVKAEDQPTEDEKEEIVERAIETLADDAGIGETLVEEDEKKMIGGIFLLDQTVVREIMVPRIDITGIERSMSFREIRELIRADGHSRFPVYEGTIDHITGILYVKDLFTNLPAPGEEFVMSAYMRKPFFVPESKVIGELLREFKMKKLHIAIVVDEYGGVSGLVTLEDVLEEIVGEIQDEHDLEEADFQAVGNGQYLVDAGLLMEDLQDHLGTDYEQGVYDTVGGLIYDLVGSVPREGAAISWHDLEFTVEAIEGQRIKRVRVARRLPSAP
ncbi:MAG: hemolysin family protein [Candidatus Zixiibacteriota bacterium]